MEKRYSSIRSLTSALDGGWWSTPHPGRFTPGKDPVPIVLGGWVGPTAGLDGCGKLRSILTLLGSGHLNLHETYQCRMYSRKLLMMGKKLPETCRGL